MKFSKISQFDLLKCISFTAPLTFINAIPFINLYIVDVFILFYVLMNNKFDKKCLLLSIFTIFLYASGALYNDTSINLSDYIQLIFVLIFISSLINNYQPLLVEKLLYYYCFGFLVSIFISLLIYVGFIENSEFFTAGRFNGVWGNPNAMGKSVAYFVLIYNVLTIKKYFNFLPTLLVNIFCVFLILTTASFSSLFMLILSYILISFYYIIINKKLFTLFLSLSLVIVFISFLPFVFTLDIIPVTFTERVLSVTSLEDAGSGNSKFLMNKAGFLYFLNNPFFGLGLENSKLVSINLGIDNSIHNFYILLLVEGGLFVFFSFLIMVLSLINKSVLKTQNLFFVLIIIFFIVDLNVKNNMFSRYKLFPWVLLFLNLRVVSEKSISYKRSKR